MMNLFQVAATLPLLLASAVAQSVDCRTTMGTRSLARVPTTTIITTSSIRPTQVLAVSSTITTYSGTTSVSVIYTTKTYTVTDTTDTETAWVEATSWRVATRSETLWQTVTTTDYVKALSTSTTIWPTATGFVPISGTYNKGPMLRRDIQHPHEGRQARRRQQGVLAMSRPNNVVCTRYNPNTRTVTSYTTLKPQVATRYYVARVVRSISELPVTQTIIPDIVTEVSTSTITTDVQTTTTYTSTSTTNSVSTTTDIIPGPTLFDACKENNYFGPDFRANSGDPKVGVTDYYVINTLNNGANAGSEWQTVANGAKTREECCYACQKSPICETFTFRRGTRNCFLMSHRGATCAAQEDRPNFFLAQKGKDPGDGWVVGNGNCGYTYSGNSDSSLFRVESY